MGKDHSEVARESNGSRLPSDPDEIERAIEQRREHLAATVNELVVRAHPKEVARRSARSARHGLRDLAFTPDGQLRYERLAAVVAVVLVLSGLVTWRRRRAH
jgi:hypothetical protein